MGGNDEWFSTYITEMNLVVFQKTEEDSGTLLGVSDALQMH